MRTILVWGSVLLLQGCLLRVGPGPVRVVGASRGPLDQSEAIATGNQVCASRGFACQLESVKRAGHRVWKLHYRIAAGGSRGEYKLELDADTGQVLKEKQNLKQDKHEKHHKHDKRDKHDGRHGDDD